MSIYGSNFDYGMSDFYKDDGTAIGNPVTFDTIPIDLFFDILEPDIFVFKDVSVDFTATPVYGSAPLNVMYTATVSYRGSYAGKFKVKEYHWFFDPINNPTEYISTTDKTIYKVYVGSLGAAFSTKLNVVLEPINIVNDINWIIGTAATITWDFSDVLSDVKIELSRNGGSSWETIIASTENIGVYNWLVEGTATNSALIRISGLQYINPVDSSIIDFSDIVSESFNPFSIIRV